MSSLVSDILISEYEDLISNLGTSAENEQIISALVQNHAWTERGATEIVKLSQMYGTAILRNALALAAALGIEDGESGL